MNNDLGRRFLTFFKYFLSFVGFSVLGSVLVISFCTYSFMNLPDSQNQMQQNSFLSEDKVVVLKLEGIILSESKFLESLLQYRSQKSIKAIVVVVNSPGGVVGKSQELYQEILKTKTVYKKPVIMYFESVAASGAYYAAVAGDYIFTNKGTLVGSIGVVSEFVNLKDLYKWARVKRFSIHSGKFKDSGNSYRDMTAQEKAYFQGLGDEILSQFKTDIKQARKIDSKVLDKYADGRVFTGEKAVSLGFADKIGSLSDAISYAGRVSGLGDKPKYFFHKEKIPGLISELFKSQGLVKNLVNNFNHLELFNAPLYLFSNPLGF